MTLYHNETENKNVLNFDDIFIFLSFTFVILSSVHLNFIE